MEGGNERVLATRKKPCYPVGEGLRGYLARYGRELPLPVSYARLLQYEESVALYDAHGQDTLWETVLYPQQDMPGLSRDLIQIYAIVKAEGDYSERGHLVVDRVDYCSFGNSHPFRIRVVNVLNDNHDYYYIKRADASRVYGLELEHLLSPNRLHFITCEETLVEEHIAGIPGDIFLQRWFGSDQLNEVRLAKELVKFNERCFVRLLGDMRAYNFVVDLTPDFDDIQIRIRAMDFDQQSYSGRKNFYLPQFFKDNYPLVAFCEELINRTTAAQYQREEHAQINRRAQGESVKARLAYLLECMGEARISPPEKVVQLRESLAEHYGNREFLRCERMGELLKVSLDHMSRHLRSTHPSRPTGFTRPGFA